MQHEMDFIQNNQTWRLVDLPQWKKPITTCWVYKVKPNLDVKPEKFKVRLVACGFEYNEGVDFKETFAPVVKWNTIKSLITFVAHNNWDTFTLTWKLLTSWMVSWRKRYSWTSLKALKSKDKRIKFVNLSKSCMGYTKL